MKQILQIILIIFYLQTPALAQELGEGFDRQSAEEISAANREIRELFWDAKDPDLLSDFQKSRILSQYDHLDPKHLISRDLLEKAVLFFDLNKSKFPNQKFITIADFKFRSDFFRFFLLNLKTGEVSRFHTTHGWASDSNNDDIADVFSNRIGSGMTSLGFARTAEVYLGKYGRSLRMDGLSSTNSNLRKRAIVIHGFDRVRESDILQPVSWGCLALDWTLKDHVIDQIRSGSLILMSLSE